MAPAAGHTWGDASARRRHHALPDVPGRAGAMEELNGARDGDARQPRALRRTGAWNRGVDAFRRRPIRPNSGRRAESSPAAGGMGYGPAEAPAAVRGRRA